MVQAQESLLDLNAEQLRELAAELIAKLAQQSQQHAVAIAAKDSDIQYRQTKIDKLTHELATLKRWKFGRSSELLNAAQISWLDETLDADIAAIEEELKELASPGKLEAAPRQQP
jgi:DNA anti-recombination protein RmuC